jgi:hypothetical protein
MTMGGAWTLNVALAVRGELSAERLAAGLWPMARMLAFATEPVVVGVHESGDHAGAATVPVAGRCALLRRLLASV